MDDDTLVLVGGSMTFQSIKLYMDRKKRSKKYLTTDCPYGMMLPYYPKGRGRHYFHLPGTKYVTIKVPRRVWQSMDDEFRQLVPEEQRPATRKRPR